MKNPFKKNKKLIGSGRGGFVYIKDEKKYYIASEWLVGNPNIVLYSNDVFLNDNLGNKIQSDEKKIILEEVYNELKEQGLSVEIYPELR